MTIPLRHSSPVKIISNSRTFFATSSIYDKRSLLQSERSAGLFVDVLLHYRSNYLLHEFVVMPDHFHVLLTVDSQISIEKAMQLIKGGFAFRAAREFGFHPPIWQKGFSESGYRNQGRTRNSGTIFTRIPSLAVSLFTP